MAAHWAESLESLQFWKYIRLSSADIDLILSTCSKLKTFAISCPQELIVKLGQDKRLGLDAWNPHEDHGNVVTWACLELENLEVMFLDNFDSIATGNPNSNGASGPTDNSNQQEQAIANGIESIYRKLGCLTRLRRIRVGWQNIHGVFPKRKSLDMSIESGLKHMGRLKNLETLDLRDIYSAGIGQDEVEWMAENWPKLWEIKGLFHKPKRDLFGRECGLDDEVEEPMHSPHADDAPHFQWLKCRRPNIMIC
ncbi:hypothetical protein BGZ80_000917 [Entomortierella chlamydospora]|uniref:Uncharacterized protein n=1 Tax=Entomortierella chlamydospora TaxID=101097 RepID=A0A9P6MSE2_9FUNG|nr:hypothetical protein BGZ79_001214 [Entomortierella chlamydospora]KAG0011151.1 hypothetical protein BGZ80_000917 [Entomortierella chlamydospora]